jgi:hypothetical protein
MQLDDPFPIPSCSRRVREAILAKFGGCCPTVREVISISDAQWLKAPGIGSFAVEELHRITQDLFTSAGDRPLAGLSNAELLSERNRLRRELNSIRSDLQTITAELLFRGVTIPGLNLRPITKEASE